MLLVSGLRPGASRYLLSSSFSSLSLCRQYSPLPARVRNTQATWSFPSRPSWFFGRQPGRSKRQPILYFSTQSNNDKDHEKGGRQGLSRENIYTIPNALTLSRILSCPLLAWSILDGNFALATSILVYAGLSDWVDGFLARRYQMRSVLGTILDPAADKTLMTTLTVTLAMKDLIPVPLACVILGRDVLLSFAAFYIRYKTLPCPKTMKRYWDFSIPSAEVHPTAISKVNTALQLVLMGATTISPLIIFDMGLILQSLQWTVAGTTIWSGLSYVFSTSAVRVVSSGSSKKDK